MVKKNTQKNWKVISLSAVFAGAVIASIVNLYLERSRSHDYVCQIVGADSDLGMLAMKCITK